MSKTKLPKDSVTPPVSAAAQAAEMESEGQGQSTSVPPQAAPARGRHSKRAQDVDSVEKPGIETGVESIDGPAEGAEADQDIDTAGTEMDEER